MLEFTIDSPLIELSRTVLFPLDYQKAVTNLITCWCNMVCKQNYCYGQYRILDKLPSSSGACSSFPLRFTFFLDLEDDLPFFQSFSPIFIRDPCFVSKASDWTKPSVLWKIRRRNIGSSDGDMHLESSSMLSYVTSSTMIGPVKGDVT